MSAGGSGSSKQNIFFRRKGKAKCIDEEEFNNSIIKTFAVASGLLPFRGGPALYLDTDR